MDKNSRQPYSAQKSNGNDNKKEISNRNLQGRRHGNFSTGSSTSYNDNQNRKPVPQKYKGALDKRPRSRGEFSDENRSDPDELKVEYGAAIQAGSKKGNLNHLLNFTYEHEVSHGRVMSGAAWTRRRQGHYRSGNSRGSKVCYNKEQFLQANCQFVVKEGGDYSVHLMNPDVLVHWDAIEQVRVIGTEPPSCPVCLHYPVAAKMTRCGHIYCWACILHYLALGEKTWRKCPICYESVHSDDLKSVVFREVAQYKLGDTITLTLMKKEKGSIYAVPANLWQKRTSSCHNLQETEEVTRHLKLLTASPEQVLTVVENERNQLQKQLTDAEPSEEPFIKGAQQQLKDRETRLQDKHIVQKEIFECIESILPNTDCPKGNIPAFRHSNDAKKVKHYKSAFSDEEEEDPIEELHKLEDSGEVQPSTDLDTASKDVSEGQLHRYQSAPLTIKEDQSVSKKDELLLLMCSPDVMASPMKMMSDIMSIEETAEQLELPTHHHGDKTRHKSADNAYYFYQADDGQHIYLHSLNARCLLREYGSLENCPQKISGNIVEKEYVFVTEELRKRLRYLSHLPLTCGFEVVELALKPPLVDKETLKFFSVEIEKRRKRRQQRAREEKQRSRYIDEQERQKHGFSGGTIVPSQFKQTTTISSNEKVSDARSDTSSSPSQTITPLGSPLKILPSDLNVHASEFMPDSNQLDEGHQTTTLSFAQMLKADVRSTVWAKTKIEASKPSKLTGPYAAGSDESENEDKVPVPEFHSSFGSALEAAFETIDRRDPTKNNPDTSAAKGRNGKKKRKQLVLFSTSMARGGK